MNFFVKLFHSGTDATASPDNDSSLVTVRVPSVLDDEENEEPVKKVSLDWMPVTVATLSGATVISILLCVIIRRVAAFYKEYRFQFGHYFRLNNVVEVQGATA